FALAGILVINATTIFAVRGSIPGFFIPIPAAERLLQDLILVLIESKFFTLFSLLFGIGFSLQMKSAERQGTAFLPRIGRRLLALLGFGALHAALLWEGDILVIYAFVGMLLIPFRRCSTRTLTRWSVGLLAVPAVGVVLVTAGSLLARLDPALATSLGSWDSRIVSGFERVFVQPALGTMGFRELVPLRWAAYLEVLPLLVSRVPSVLAMFLLGLVVERTGMVADIRSHRVLLGRVRRAGLLLGFALMASILGGLKALPTTSAFALLLLDQYVLGPVLSLGYAATVALWVLDAGSSRLGRGVGAAGRMALTNYLTQSVCLTFVAYGWGLGRYATWGGYRVLGLCALVYLGQVVLSRLWLRHFAFGPLEWVWRSVTYGRFPSWSAREADGPTPAG
ncbi:MAG: hypothetical protein RL199_881, partial [Pseudomonadota bacterium]